MESMTIGRSVRQIECGQYVGKIGRRRDIDWRLLHAEPPCPHLDLVDRFFAGDIRTAYSSPKTRSYLK